MKVQNWMQTDPHVITGDLLVSEAKRILSENNLHALPVVEDGNLRGMITRASCLRAAHFVSQTLDVNEFKYFSNRLKVKDIMVYNPATMDAEDTMEECLEKGRDIGVGQFPVLKDGRVVGVISANEIFNLAAHFLGAWENRSGVTLAPMVMGPGIIGRISDIVEATGAEVHAIYPIGTAGRLRDGIGGERKIIIRFHSANVPAVVNALGKADFEVIEWVDARDNKNGATAKAS